MKGERPDLESLSALPADEPVVMVNLLKFAAGGRETYRRYAEEAAPHLERVGAKVRYFGDVGATVLGEGAWWDAIMLVEYPSPKAFVDMVSDPGYGQAHQLRNAALECHDLIATTTTPP